jgi:hypothetical protein
VLKKAGIVVATAAAGLLAVSPLAFAGDKGHDEDDGHRGDKKHHSSHDSRYDHNNNNNGDRTFVDQDGDGGNNACSNVQVADVDAIGGNSGLLGLLPILNGNNALNNVNALQCVNVLNNNLNGNDIGIGILGSNRGGDFDNAEFDN